MSNETDAPEGHDESDAADTPVAANGIVEAIGATAAHVDGTDRNDPDSAIAAEAAAPTAPVDEADVEAADGAPFMIEEWVYGAIEALCFVSADPVTPARAKDVIVGELPALRAERELPPMAPPSASQLKDILQELLRRWGDPTRTVGQGFRLVEVDGGLAFRTQASQARFVRRMQLGKPQKLSRAALETLAVVAYRQPVTKPQIEEVRGVDCSGALKALLDKRLVRILGKAEDVGRPLLYGTSKTFLEFFNLQSLNDLPTLKQLQELEGVVTTPDAGTEAGPAMVMDLFQQDGAGLVSSETEHESQDALDALERALGEAKKVAKTASTLVFGIEVPDEDQKPPREPE